MILAWGQPREVMKCGGVTTKINIQEDMDDW